MSDTAFLRTILDSPEQNTPRLVYADWLDDHDQPERAAEMRRQTAWSARYTAAALAVAVIAPIPDGWPGEGWAWPVRAHGGVRLGRVFRAAGWPTVVVPIDRPGHLPATCVPESWLAELAGLLNVPLAGLMHGVIESEAGE